MKQMNAPLSMIRLSVIQIGYLQLSVRVEKEFKKLKFDIVTKRDFERKKPNKESKSFSGESQLN